MIVGKAEEITKKEQYADEPVFASSHKHAALNHEPQCGYQTLPKVVWMDVPKVASWILPHVGKWEGHSNNTSWQLAKAMIDMNKTPKELKVAISFFQSHRFHVFTYFYKDGVCRWRMTKKAGVNIAAKWGKKGIASTIQGNRFYVHYKFNADVYVAHALASIPEIRMEALEYKEKQNINEMERMINYGQTMLEKHAEKVEKMDDGAIIEDAIDEVVRSITGMSMPNPLARIYTGYQYFQYGSEVFPKEYHYGSGHEDSPDLPVNPLKAFAKWRDDVLTENVLNPALHNETRAQMHTVFMETYLLWNKQVEQAKRIEEKVRAALTSILQEEKENEEVTQDE